ncbi:LysE family translocator [Psychrobacter lutiphocae]|uniref:LysE family translocator n=1 Tax=Psychrobacter lutiphocae TaxID=540500 RepID=UPI00036D53A9|nr:LysE family translocator [Psychrobacter lutiphocae]
MLTNMMTGLEGSIFALAVFILINSITPGPNNLMLLHGGIKKGLWGCRGHLLGITFGAGVMTWLSYWGMAAIVVDHPTLMLGIKILGTLYLLWLTYQMAMSDFSAMVTEALKLESSEDADAKIKKKFGELPLTFWQAALFQWLNPKTWTMTVMLPSIALIHTADIGAKYAGLANWPLIILCMLVSLLSIAVWAAGGQWLRRLVHNPKLMKLIHIIIVAMTLYCAVALWV